MRASGVLILLVQTKSVRGLPASPYRAVCPCITRHARVRYTLSSKDTELITDKWERHVSIFNGEYDALVWVPVLIWFADRVMRYGRIVCFNWRFWNTQGLATFDPSSNMVRLEVPLASSLYKVRPGTFFYLSTVDDSAFWESHPFTVASISHPQKEVNTSGEASPLLEASGPSLSGLISETISEESMTFLIRPYDSFTGRLRDRAEAHWPKPATVRMAIDGPYGRTLPLNLFNHVCFVVGGSGIVVMLSYIRTLLASSQCRKIEIHWAAREPALAEEVIKRDLREALGSDKVSVGIYLTGGSGPAGISGGSEVSWHRRRLNVTATIAEATSADLSTPTSLAVVACGPANMSDDARCASVDAMRQMGTRKRIEYFEESFQW